MLIMMRGCWTLSQGCYRWLCERDVENVHIPLLLLGLSLLSQLFRETFETVDHGQLGAGTHWLDVLRREILRAWQ